MDLPSISEIRGKRLIFEGICETLGVENMEVCLPFPSQPPESSSFPSCSLELPLPSPFGPHLLSSVSLSQSPRENQVTSEIFSEKALLALFIKNMLAFLSVMRRRTSVPYQTNCPRVLLLGSLHLARLRRIPTCCQVVRGILWYPHQAISLLMACPPGKWLKCERFYALWILRFIPGGKTVAPQAIET
ncbi:hypothetical protein CK203_004884 [Vitis vinifera]|uniref:Uncharacterized protein n=1 Tax=Vitis vinifera TaxID=29760 RepID=A0A438KG07_VITVI|nr:hypothetical protein CK203_004884 [Vitis vinifera]